MARGDGPPPRISVVIPTWRDADNLATLLPRVSKLPGVAEVIVVNASRDLRSEQLAQDFGAVYLKVFPPNRGLQMNTGAEAARGDIILFQHADTDLREEHTAAIQHALRERSVIGGAFYRKFDGRHPRLMWLEPVTRFLSRHGGTLYGDQSIFVRREAFQRLGGYATIPLMEDVDFSRHLRAAGRIVLLDPPVESSARHHKRKGAWRTTMRNALFIVLYKLGVSPFRLHRWYYPPVEVSKRAPSGPRASATGAKPAAR